MPLPANNERVKEVSGTLFKVFVHLVTFLLLLAYLAS